MSLFGHSLLKPKHFAHGGDPSSSGPGLEVAIGIKRPESSGLPPEIRAAGEDVLAALKSGNVEEFADALYAFTRISDALPHDEGDDEGDDEGEDAAATGADDDIPGPRMGIGR